MTIQLFVGWDAREAVGLHTFIQSVLEHASVPVSITPLTAAYLPRVSADRGITSNHFTFARFAVPRLCGYGEAIFVDGSDMLCRGDIAELEALRSRFHAVQCVQHEYSTRFPRKYLGTSMESPNFDYPRKQWASVMLINGWHHAWRDAADDRETLQLRFIEDRLIGALPVEWNWLCDEHGPNPGAKLLHFTAGIPAFAQHAGAAHADEWFAARDRAMTATG